MANPVVYRGFIQKFSRRNRAKASDFHNIIIMHQRNINFRKFINFDFLAGICLENNICHLV